MLIVVIGIWTDRGWLLFEGMEFSVTEEHWLGSVFVVMREGAVALCHVEAKNGESDGADELLLERTLLLVGLLVDT